MCIKLWFHLAPDGKSRNMALNVVDKMMKAVLTGDIPLSTKVGEGIIKSRGKTVELGALTKRSTIILRTI